MLRNIKDLYGNTLAASDGDVGRVRDFYFDDRSWVIRYVVADTGSWLPQRLILLSPHAFGHFDEVDGKALRVALTRKQIEDSPSMEAHQPVSRQFEIDHSRYYGWPAYWTGTGLLGEATLPVLPPPLPNASPGHPPASRNDPHLRSAEAVIGYQVQTAEGVTGHVSDFLIDDKTWAIRQVAVKTGSWYFAKNILISPEKVLRISHEEEKVFISLTQADIRRTQETK
jgi:hypothetical protein